VATWEARNALGMSRTFAIDWLWHLSLELTVFALGVALFFVIFKFLPSRRIVWRTALVAAVFCSLGFEVAKRLYALYVTRFATLDRVASDANIIALFLFLLWVYYTAYLFLLGGEVRRRTIWSACGSRSGCNSAKGRLGDVAGGNPPPSSTNLHNLHRPPYLGMMSTGGPLRQPIPVARSILWSPESAGGGGGAQRPGHIPFPVFLSQSALTAIHEHVATPARPGQGVLGFLLGDLCECPETNVSYLVIDAALRLNQAIYGDRTRDVITRLWDRVQEQLETQQAHLIGWYHTHPPLPLSLSEHDVETHEHYFGEPWQVTLLLGTDPEDPAAGFFRAGPDESWLATPLPFYELLAPESIRPDGKKRSFVTWKNHRAYNPVTPPAAPTLRTPAAKPPSEPRFTPASANPQPSPPPPPAPPPPAPPPPLPRRDDDRHELKFLTAARTCRRPRRPGRRPPATAHAAAASGAPARARTRARRGRADGHGRGGRGSAHMARRVRGPRASGG